MKENIRRESYIISAEKLEENAERLVKAQEQSGTYDKTPIAFYAKAATRRLIAGDSRGAARDYSRAEKLAKLLAEHDSSYNPRNFLLDLIGAKVDRSRKPAAGVAAAIEIIGGLTLLSPNITGNAIANMTISSSNALGAVLLVVGLVAGYFWMKK